MKIFLPLSVLSRTQFADTLAGQNIDVATDYNDVECTGFLTLLEPEPIHFSNINDAQSYAETHKGSSTSFLAAKIGINSNEGLADKFELYNALNNSGKPTLTTIFPTTLQQIEDFFNTHPVVFCKPRIGSRARAAHSISLINVDGTPSDVVEYISSIPRPSSLNHYYKKYTSYNDFIEDIDVTNFLLIQNSNKGLLSYQCVLQVAEDVFNTAFYNGWVNANGDIYFEPKSDWFQTQFPPDANTNIRYGNDSVYAKVDAESFMSDYASISSTNDPEGMYAYIQDVFTQNNIKSTPFSVQILKKNDDLILVDFSTRATKLIGNEWSSSSLITNRLEYMYDQATTIIPDDNYHCFFVCYFPPEGLTPSVINLIRSLNMKFVYPVLPSHTFGSLRAYGTSILEIKNNIKQLLTGLSTL